MSESGVPGPNNLPDPAEAAGEPRSVPKYDVFCTYYGREFTRLAIVLRKSIKANCPEANVTLKETWSARGIRGLPQNAADNLLKLTQWWPFAMEADRPFVLMDADTLVVNDFGDVWEREFDIAYCTRPHRCPLIGGVIFCRPTEATRRFITNWLAEATSVALHPDAKTILPTYGGLLQSGLNRLRNEGLDYLKVEELPARIWNCCDQVWHLYDESETKIVHLKGRLRREVLKGRARESGPNSDLAPIVKRYCEYMMA